MIMTKQIEKLPPEARQAFALAFKGIGGVPALIRWGKQHRSAFYSIYAKLIPMQVQADANVNVRVESDEQIRASLEHAFHRIIDAQYDARGDAAKVIVDARANPETSSPAP